VSHFSDFLVVMGSVMVRSGKKCLMSGRMPWVGEPTWRMVNAVRREDRGIRRYAAVLSLGARPLMSGRQAEK